MTDIHFTPEPTPYPDPAPICAVCDIVILPRVWLHAFHSLDGGDGITEAYHATCVEVIGETS